MFFSPPQVSTSYYVFHVHRKLKVAEDFLKLMGYFRLQGSSDLILHRFSQQDLYSIVADIVILHEDLKIVVFILDRVSKWSRTLTGVPTEFKHVMLARKLGPPMKMECLGFFMSGHVASSEHTQISEHIPLTPSNTGYSSQAPLTSTPNQPFPPESSYHNYHRGSSGSTQLEDSMSSELMSSSELPPPIMTKSQLQNMMRGIGSSYASNSSFDREEKVVSPTQSKSASYPTDNTTRLPQRDNSFENTPSGASLLHRRSSSSSSVSSGTSWGQTSFTRNLYQAFKTSESSPIFIIGEEDSPSNEQTSPPQSRQGRGRFLQKGFSVDSSTSDSAYYPTQPGNQYPSNQYATDQYDGQYNQPTNQYDSRYDSRYGGKQYDSHYGNQVSNTYNYQPTDQPHNSRDKLPLKQEPTIRSYVNIDVDEISRRGSTENALPRRGSADALIDVEKSLKPPVPTPRRNSSHSSYLYLKQQDVYSQQGGIPEEEEFRKGISLSENIKMVEGNPSSEWRQMKGVSPRNQGDELRRGILLSESGKTWGGSKQEGDMIRQSLRMESSSGSLETSRTWGGGKQEGEKIRQSLRAGQERGLLVSSDSSYSKRTPFTSTGASAYSGSVINDSRWVCQSCSTWNQRDDNYPACIKCGKIPSWVTTSSQYNYSNVGALNTVSSHYITERGHSSIVQTDSLSSPIVKPSKTTPPFITPVLKQWTCHYCLHENTNNTNKCDVCNESSSN